MRASGDLAQRTEQQAATFEKSSAALSGITTDVDKTAKGTSQARGVVGMALADAQKGTSVVEDTIGAMSRIEIPGDPNLANHLCHRRNRVPDQFACAQCRGRGRARRRRRTRLCVASEVRALAQRSSQAAKEIRKLIDSSASEVSAGVDLVAKTGQALSAIAAKVHEISQLVDGISESAQRQATGINDMNIAVREIDQLTQQNAGMAEEANAAGKTLAQETRLLVELVGKFRIGPEHRQTSPQVDRRAA